MVLLTEGTAVAVTASQQEQCLEEADIFGLLIFMFLHCVLLEDEHRTDDFTGEF